MVDMEVLEDAQAQMHSDAGAYPPVMTGATFTTDGKAGLVPAPPAGGQGKYLRGDGTWETPTGSGNGGGGGEWEYVGASVMTGHTLPVISYADGIVVIEPGEELSGKTVVLRKLDYSSHSFYIFKSTGVSGQYQLTNHDGVAQNPTYDETTQVFEVADAGGIGVSGTSEYRRLKIRVTNPCFITHGMRKNYTFNVGSFSPSVYESQISGRASVFEAEMLDSPIDGKMYIIKTHRGGVGQNESIRACTALVDTPVVPSNVRLGHYNGMLTVGTMMEVWGAKQ